MATRGEWRKFIKISSYLTELRQVTSKALWKWGSAALLPSPFQASRAGGCQWGEKLEISRPLAFLYPCP